MTFSFFCFQVVTCFWICTTSQQFASTLHLSQIRLHSVCLPSWLPLRPEWRACEKAQSLLPLYFSCACSLSWEEFYTTVISSDESNYSIYEALAYARYCAVHLFIWSASNPQNPWEQTRLNFSKYRNITWDSLLQTRLPALPLQIFRLSRVRIGSL